MIGVEFAHMCASILFRPDNGTWPDLRIEAKDISVNGQKYTDRTAIALQERESMLELPINLKHIDRRGNCYEDFYNIQFSLEITSDAGAKKNETGIVTMELDMAQYTSITDEELVRLRKRDVKNAEKRS